MIQKIKEILYRWRTWIVNTALAIILVLPELVTDLLGFDWSSIVPPNYMPWVTLFILILNVWMRPRPAVLPHDPEVIVSKLKREE